MRLLRETLALAGLALQVTMVGYFWRALPPQVPMHFGISGAADDYGGKSTLLILPVATLLLYGLLTVVSLSPQRFNFPVEVTEENRDRLEAIAISMMGWLKAELTWFFAYIGWAVIRVALGQSNGLGWAFLPVTAAAIAFTVVAGIVRIRRAA
jgi:hypothetical protein